MRSRADQAATAAESCDGDTGTQVLARDSHPPTAVSGMNESRYRLGFTSGGLLAREADIAASLYRQLGDWAKVRAAIKTDNLLQTRTVSSGHRLAREVVQRLAELTDDEIDLLADATSVERGHLMWVAVCRRYALLGEFAEEVLRERFLLLAPTLDHADFNSFMRTKATWHEELAGLKESTYRKLRSNVFLMLHEAGLLSDHGHITPVVLTNRLAAAFATGTDSDVRFFPTNSSVSPRTER